MLLVALKYHPALVKPAVPQVLLPDPEAQHSSVSPHHSNIVVGIQLEKQNPISPAGLQLLCSRVLVAGSIAAV